MSGCNVGEKNGATKMIEIIHHDLQTLAIVDLKLTNLQITGLNEIGSQIEDGAESYESVAESLSTAEDTYLRAWLENAGIEIPERVAEVA